MEVRFRQKAGLAVFCGVRVMSGIELTPFHDWLVELRRAFHRNPELSYGEIRTSRRIAEVLREMGVEVQTGIGGTGILARIESRRPGPVVAFRADMDALPLQEISDAPYRSAVPGVMHACGHDGHMTIALGVARTLMEEQWPARGRGKVLIVLQPAEEGGAGALAMLRSGAFDGEPIDAIFAGHVHPELPVGHVGVAPGVCNAASDSVRMRITGKGGHGAQPHRCVDPIVAGAALVTQLQSLVSRSISPMDSAVLTIGQFVSGTASNIIPQEALLSGTLRTLRPEVRDAMVERIDRMVKGLELAYGVKVHLEIIPGYPLLVNDSNVAEMARGVASDFLGPDRVHVELPRMGAEDFAYFLQRYPGVLLRLGCHKPEEGFRHALHSPHFDMDERALDVGVGLFVRLIKHRLGQA
ncbi:MAG: M20 family metallopeptidase [Syntrophobacteraceae bacterium]|jgi:amidohydrolase|nr:M20 family metallopeptidase [Syntrophobacteraceae bacterium]